MVLPKGKEIKAMMTNEMAKVYIQYVKVILSKYKEMDDTIEMALDMADDALGEETLFPDPRFNSIR